MRGARASTGHAHVAMRQVWDLECKTEAVYTARHAYRMLQEGLCMDRPLWAVACMLTDAKIAPPVPGREQL